MFCARQLLSVFVCFIRFSEIIITTQCQHFTYNITCFQPSDNSCSDNDDDMSREKCDLLDDEAIDEEDDANENILDDVEPSNEHRGLFIHWVFVFLF